MPPLDHLIALNGSNGITRKIAVMGRLLCILLLILHSTAYTAKKGVYWIESGGLIGNQVNALSLEEYACIANKIDSDKKSYVKEAFSTFCNSKQTLLDLESTEQDYEQVLSELSNKIKNIILCSNVLEGALRETRPLNSHIRSLQSGIGYQFSKYFALEIDHLIFSSTTQLDTRYFAFKTKKTRTHSLLVITKPSLPIYSQWNVYIPLGLGLIWTQLYNGPDTLSIPMQIPRILGLGVQYELSDQWTLHGEWMHVRIPEIGPFNLFKVGFQLYKS